MRGASRSKARFARAGTSLTRQRSAQLSTRSQRITPDAPSEFDAKERQTRERQLRWWSQQFAGLSLAEVTADRISLARDKLAAEAFSRGRPHKHPRPVS